MNKNNTDYKYYGSDVNFQFFRTMEVLKRLDTCV